MKMLLRIGIIGLITAVILTACGQRGDQVEELPTPVPTAALPEPTPEPTPIPPVDETTIDWPPQVLFVTPEPNQPAMLDGTITVRFDQPMERGTVEYSFFVREAGGAVQTIPGVTAWPRPDTIQFTPVEPFERAQRYVVEITDTAVSANGIALPETVQYEVETVGFLDVAQVVPAPDSPDVLTDTPITVFFNRPVVSLVTSDQQANLPQPLTFDPPVAGEGEWLSTSIYQFTPDPTLAGATTYRLSVDATLTDVTGGVLQDGFSWQFTTIPPSVFSVEPSSGATGVRLEEPFTVTFNMPMNRESVETAVSLQGGSSPTFSFDWSDDSTVLTITPDAPLELGTQYQLLIGQSATAASGDISLFETSITSFETVPLPAVLSSTPANGQQADRFQRGFVLRFNAPMDLETLEDNILINPAPEGRINYFFNEFSNELIVDFTYEPSTRYGVTVPRTAADPYGNILGDSYEFIFTSPPLAPVASFNLPRNVAQFSTSFVSRVDLIHVNVSETTVALYDLGLPVGLATRPFEVTEYRPASEPIRTWQLDLRGEENVPNVAGVQLADSGSLPTGIYLITVESPETNQAQTLYWQNQSNLLIVSDTNLVVKEMVDSVHVWATSLRTGEPEPNLAVTLYDTQGVPLGNAQTDGNGFASFPYESSNSFLDGVTVVSNQPGQLGFGVGSSVWNEGAEPWKFDIPVNTSKEAENYVYLYSDRPIYRPGDTVYFKGIARQTDYGRYAPTTAQETTVTIRFNGFANGQEYSNQLNVEIMPDGTLSGQFDLPDGVPVGPYSLSLDGQNLVAGHGFTVADYRRPEFIVEFDQPNIEALRGDMVEVGLTAEYFFGGSAADLPVEWNVYSESFRFQPVGPYFEYGNSAGFGVESVSGGFFGFVPDNPFGLLLSGTGVTDGNGRFTITIPADLLADAEAGSRQLRVEALISDISNFPVAANANVTLHAAETYVGIKPASSVSSAGDTATFELQTVDWDGVAVPNQTVEVRYFERVWEATRQQDLGGYFTQWEAVDTEVASETVGTDGNGVATGSFIPEAGGTYVAVATVRDGNGRSHLSSTQIWVSDSSRVGWRLDPSEKVLRLVPDLPEYTVGDTAEILVQSPFDQPVQAWLTIERGTLIEQRLITLNGSSDVLQIPIDTLYAPNVFVTVTAIKPFNPDDPNEPQADIRLGIAELIVDPAPLSLNVELMPQEGNLSPRDTAVFDIQVTDAQGNGVQADLSLALVDKAILTLKEDQAPPILEAFYQRQPYRSQVGSGLFFSGENLPVELPIEGGGGFGGGGGGAVAEDAVALRGGEDDDVRADFPDTAYWQANVQTDGSGRASVSIDLPDTLTTWVLSSKAATANTLVGESSTEIVTALPLLLRPVTPRFFTVGDVVQLGTVVNNNTGGELETAVSLEASGVDLQSPAEQTVTVPANGQTLVRWTVSVPDGEFADLTFRASSGELSDATKPSFGVGPNNQIPIYRYTARDIAATAGVMSGASRVVEAVWLPEDVDEAQGSLTVEVESSLIASLLGTVEELNFNEVRQECATAVSDALLTRLVAAQISAQFGVEPPMPLEEIDLLIDRLAELQRLDGGWGWCGGSASIPYFSAQTQFTLIQAQDAGFAVPDKTIADGAEYLNIQTVIPEAELTPERANNQLFMLYVLSLTDPVDAGVLNTIYDRSFEQLLPESRALMLLMLHRQDALPQVQDALLAALEGTAVLSATGSYWDSDAGYVALQTDVRNTAVVLYALNEMTANNMLLSSTVRWLMSARQGRFWQTEQDTAWVTFALLNWATATDDTNASFEYRVLVDLQNVVETAVSPETAAETTKIPIGIEQLATGEAHFVEIQRQPGAGNLYYNVYLDAALDASRVQSVDRGIQINRVYYDAACDPEEEDCQPLTSITAGEQVRVELTMVVANNLRYVIIDDPIPSGTEPLDPNLDTTGAQFDASAGPPEPYSRGYWGYWNFTDIAFQDERVSFSAEFLPAGTYQYTYFLQATIPGEYQVMPTFGRQLFMPEVNGRSDGLLITITE